MDKIEKFRERLRGQSEGKAVPQRSMQFKDWAAMLFSLASLGISALTAFFVTLRQIDDLRAVVLEAPTVYYDYDVKQFVAAKDATLMFINAGNRVISVTAVTLSVTQPDDYNSNFECRVMSDGASDFVYFKVDPFVIKPGEIATKKFEVKLDRWDRLHQGHKVIRVQQSKKKPEAFKDENLIQACLNFTVTTPSEIVQTIYVPIFIDAFHVDQSKRERAYDPVYLSNKPITLLSHRRNILFD